jgi:2-polyprenyl-6-methoxyphenol hydroxylase-like FAD-dependent oxidoreductase
MTPHVLPSVCLGCCLLALPAAVRAFAPLPVKTPATKLSASSAPTPDEMVDVLICGGGPTGLLSAIMMAQRFPNFQIHLVDEQPHPPPAPDDPNAWSKENSDRYYLLGLGGRGITALQHFGVWEESIEQHCVPVPGRKDWNGKGENVKPIETFKTERKYTTQVLFRDKLVSAMYRHIVDGRIKFPNLHLQYGCKIEPLQIAGNNGSTNCPRVLVNVTAMSHTENLPSVTASHGSKIMSASVVVAADGSARTFANEMQRIEGHVQRKDDNTAHSPESFQVIRYPDDNQKVYKNIALSVPTEWRKDINYAVRTDRVIFDMLPANDQGDYVGILLLPKADSMARGNVDPNEFRTFLQDQIPQFIGFLDDATIASVAKRPPSTLPMFRYVTPRMHYGDGCIVLLGDCAHTVKPYFGMGANSALEDVKVLSWCIDAARQQHKNNHDDTAILKAAIQEFSVIRSPDIETLVKVSHSLDRPGVEGILTFLVPIILDGIFSKLMPQIFAPNVISMLQNEEITFQEAAERKRIDRAGQIVLLGAVGFLLAKL